MTETFGVFRKFRKKPKVVEACQWFPGKHVEGVTVVHDGGINAEGTFFPAHAFVTTIHGERASVVAGDYIVKEPDGVHYYPVKPDIFEKDHYMGE
jgi:hypothetical protein